VRHKNLYIGLLIAFLSLAFGPGSSYHAKSVYDGDTIRLNTGEKVRYLGIDAPEIGREGQQSEFMASDSKDFNTHLVAGKKIRLEFDHEEKDQYGRLLAYVYLENGEFVNALLLRRGFAHLLVRRPNIRHFAILLESQRYAMSQKIGIWSKSPSRYDRYYLGNKNSFRFHRPHCPFGKGIISRNRIRFQAREEAFWEGFSPCKQCRPEH